MSPRKQSISCCRPHTRGGPICGSLSRRSTDRLTALNSKTKAATAYFSNTKWIVSLPGLLASKRHCLAAVTARSAR
jgi:hypothetical protein